MTYPVDLGDGVVDSLGVAPISRSDVLWRALEEEKSSVIAKTIDTIGALPPASWLDARAETPVRLIDARVEVSGTVRSVLTEKGMLPEPKVTPAPAGSDQKDSGETDEETNGLGIRRHAPETWRLWLGRHSTEIDLCRALCTSQNRRRAGLANLSAEGELLVESLLERVGSGALELLVEVLREAVPPRDEPRRVGLRLQ